MITIQVFISVMLIYTIFIILAFWRMEISTDRSVSKCLRDIREIYFKSLYKYTDLILKLADEIDILRNEIEKLKKEK